LISPDYRKWDCAVCTHPSLEAFLSAVQIKNGIHAINVNGHLVEFLFQKKPSDYLLIVFSGAVRRNDKNNPPFFSGIDLHKQINCSLMAISDPSLYLNSQINLAWYTGSRDLPLQSILPLVIDKVASACASYTIMTGGSGGGFASLYYATKSRQPSVALVYNPQTNIVNYLPRTVEHFARTCFDWHEGVVDSALKNIIYDLTKYFPQKMVKTIYLQNLADYRHIITHTIPFLKTFNLRWTGTKLAADDIYVHVGYWGSGHERPPIELIRHIINQLCEGKMSTLVADNLPQHLKTFSPFGVGLAQHTLRFCALVVGPAQRFSRHHRFVVPLARLVFQMASTIGNTVKRINRLLFDRRGSGQSC